jgi:CBS domain containing-hemolysin-like protein
MRKQLMGHLLFWIALISIDVTSYIPVWRDEIGTIAGINYSWILLIFYVAYLTGLSFFGKDREPLRLVKSRHFWVVIAMPIVYIFGTMITDVYLLKINDFLTVKWAYCVSRFIMIYPFISSALLLAGFRTRAIQFNMVRDERNGLYVENNALGEENDELRKEQNKLLKEINLLKFEAVASHERVADIQREYNKKLKYYEDLVRKLRGDDDYL